MRKLQSKTNISITDNLNMGIKPIKSVKEHQEMEVYAKTAVIVASLYSNPGPIRLEDLRVVDIAIGSRTWSWEIKHLGTGALYEVTYNFRSNAWIVAIRTTDNRFINDVLLTDRAVTAYANSNSN